MTESNALIFGCNFTFNNASLGGGGGIYWLYQNMIEIPELNTNTTHNEYIRNSAQYGNDYATEEVFLQYSPDGINSLYWDGMFEVSSSKTTVQLFIVDFYQQKVTIDSTSRVGWTIDSGTTCGDDTLNVCGLTSATVSAGVATFENFALTCSVGEQIDLAFKSTSSLVTNTIHVLFQFEKCVRGQIYIEDSDACITCLEGTYSLVDVTDIMNATSSCEICPSNAVCRADIVSANPGYWKAATYDDAVMKCPYGEVACKGGIFGGNASCNDGK